MAKQSPILMSGPMVRAIFDKRKTMTRRVLNPQPEFPMKFSTLYPEWAIFRNPSGKMRQDVKIQYQVGDMLWVKEAWRTWSFNDKKPPRKLEDKSRLSILYEATPNQLTKNGPLISECGKYRHNRFMPKWASRLTLEVTGVKVERLQNISEQDAIAEGVIIRSAKDIPEGKFYQDFIIPDFKDLWDSINATRKGGIHAWDKNDWVAAYTFDPIFKNVSEVE